MTITSEELAKVIYDHMRITKTVLNALDTDAGITITSATAPFPMLLEAAVTTANASALASKNDLKRVFPSLITSREEAYPHLNDDTLANMFAIPSKAYMYFFINVIDLRQYGYSAVGSNYTEIIIPKNTYITVMKSTVLTLLNDISVRLYSDGNILIEQQANDNDIAINDIGIIKSDIYNDEEQVSWIAFVAPVKQVKVTTVSPAITADDGVNVSITTSSEYCYSEAFYANAATNNIFTRLPISLTEEYINPSEPTVYAEIGTNKVNLKVPSIYTANRMISGTMKLTVYETKGSLYLPINKYQKSDFTMTLGDSGTSSPAAAARNVSMHVLGATAITGGSNGMTLEELKDSIIANTVGDIDVPVTHLQVIKLGNMNGYHVFETKDIIGDRVYVANKNLPEVNSNLVKAKQDILFNTVKVVLSDVSGYDSLIIEDSYFIIKSGTLFKMDNGVVTILNNAETNYVKSLPDLAKVSYLKNNKIYVTPFQYIISTRNGYTTPRIYSLDNPSIAGFRILSQNTSMPQNVNTSKYVFMKTTTGYRLTIALKTDANFDSLDSNYVGVQLAIPLKGDEVYVYIDGVYDHANGVYHFDINTDMYIDEDDYITVTNGSSTLGTRMINIATKAHLYIYTMDSTVVDNTKFLVDEIYRANGSRSHVVFSKERIDLEIGKAVSYLWDRIYNTFTSRKYKTYQFDYPAKYPTDVYEVFTNGSTYREVTVDGVTKLERNLLHAAGELVTDADGNTIYHYKKGDTINDGEGNPIVDTYAGIARYIDILMLEYEFYVANSMPYSEYYTLCLDTLYSYLFTDMEELNKVLIDNTRLLYKSLKTCLEVKAIKGNTSYTIPYLVKPNVTLYMTTTSTPTSIEIANYRDTIGKIIDVYLNKSTIYLSAIKADIMSALGSTVASVKISDLDSVENSEIIYLEENGGRLVLDKVLELNTANQLEVKYNVGITIQAI